MPEFGMHVAFHHDCWPSQQLLIRVGAPAAFAEHCNKNWVCQMHNRRQQMAQSWRRADQCSRQCCGSQIRILSRQTHSFSIQFLSQIRASNELPWLLADACHDHKSFHQFRQWKWVCSVAWRDQVLGLCQTMFLSLLRRTYRKIPFLDFGTSLACGNQEGGPKHGNQKFGNHICSCKSIHVWCLHVVWSHKCKKNESQQTESHVAASHTNAQFVDMDHKIPLLWKLHCSSSVFPLLLTFSKHSDSICAHVHGCEKWIRSCPPDWQQHVIQQPTAVTRLDCIWKERQFLSFLGMSQFVPQQNSTESCVNCQLTPNPAWQFQLCACCQSQSVIDCFESLIGSANQVNRSSSNAWRHGLPCTNKCDDWTFDHCQSSAGCKNSTTEIVRLIC